MNAEALSRKLGIVGATPSVGDPATSDFGDAKSASSATFRTI